MSGGLTRRLPHLSFFLPMLVVVTMLAPLGGPSGPQVAAAALYIGSPLVAMWLGSRSERPGGWRLFPPPEVWAALLRNVVLPLLLTVALPLLLMMGAAWAADGYGYPDGYPVTGAGAGAVGAGAVSVGAGMSGVGMQTGALPTWGDPLSYLLTLGPYGALLYGAVLMGRAIEKISTMQITVQVRLTDEDRAAVQGLGSSIKSLAERSERLERDAG